MFAGKHLCWRVKKRLRHRCFPVNIAKFSRALILKKVSSQGTLLMRSTKDINKPFLLHKYIIYFIKIEHYFDEFYIQPVE